MARAVIDELARGGVKMIVASPGSRSAALVIAAHEHPSVMLVMSIDERSGAFHALGWAKATGRAAAVISTSGTAPANFLPAAIEASMSLTPLVVLSADRPLEMQGVGANQTIDQKELFGRHVRAFLHLEAADASTDASAGWRAEASGVVASALGVGSTPPGPAHLNISFREPTVPATDDGRTVGEEYPYGIASWHSDEHAAPEPTAADLADLSVSGRGLVICGEGAYDRGRLRSAAARLGWPLLATALSGMRGGEVVASYHHLLADDVPEVLRPDVVFAVGSIGPSPRLEDLVASAATRVRVDYWGRYIDPRRGATKVLAADPALTLEAIAEQGSGTTDWAVVWKTADEEVDRVIGEFLDNEASMSGGKVARAIAGTDWRSLVVASSLPIREVDAHLRGDGRVLANRGASGIDGFISTALGVARSGPRTLALSGDLSLLHDSNGFLVEDRPALVTVVLDNNGGGLFDSLPPARHAPEYERLFVTPHGRDLAILAAFHELPYTESETVPSLVSSIEGALAETNELMIRVPVNREEDQATRLELDRIGASVASALNA